MEQSWIVILPPLLVLLCASITRNVSISLILGILSASMIAAQYSIIGALSKAFSSMIYMMTDINNLYLFSFLILLGIIIEMISNAGGITAYTQALNTYIKDKKSAETASMMLSCVFFLDDYFNGLTVGSIMRPVTDAMKIPRIKLAFLLNSMSGPLCLLIPATTWVAVVLNQLQMSGVSDNLKDNPLIYADPVATYLQTIPFIFYAIFIIISTIFIVRNTISFGAMHDQEIIAERTGNLFGGKEPLSKKTSYGAKNGTIIGFFIPIGFFVASMVIFIFYSGDAALLGGSNSLMIALKNSNTFWALFSSSLCTALITALYFLYTKSLTLREISYNAWHGLLLMKSSLLILILAYTFSSILINDLKTGIYLAHLISGSLPLFSLPVMIFLISTAISASIGSSWGTILIMLPLTIRILAALTEGTAQLLIEDIPNFFPAIGALLSGSAAGAHFSPITDSTIMASTSSNCYHIDHVQTQISYSTPALIGSSITFLLLGILYQSSFIYWAYPLSIISGITIMLSIIMFRKKFK